ncbi:fimbrial biogenesis chaperone [Serratia fonticola]
MAAFNVCGLTLKPHGLTTLMLIVLLAIASIPVANAEIYLGATRLIVNAKDKEATLRVSNEGRDPVSLQVWVDNGSCVGRFTFATFGRND